MELKGHKDTVHSACFTPDDSKIITIAVDKQIILWEIKHDSQNSQFYSKQIDQLETKCYMDIAVSNTRLVCIGS